MFYHLHVAHGGTEVKKELLNSFAELGMYLGVYHILSTCCIRISFFS